MSVALCNELGVCVFVTQSEWVSLSDYGRRYGEWQTLCVVCCVQTSCIMCCSEFHLDYKSRTALHFMRIWLHCNFTLLPYTVFFFCITHFSFCFVSFIGIQLNVSLRSLRHQTEPVLFDHRMIKQRSVCIFSSHRDNRRLIYAMPALSMHCIFVS